MDPNHAEITEATELVYIARPSWGPPLFALGLAAVFAGVIVWWPYGVAGAIVALVALWMMVRAAGSDTAQLPRQQQLTTAVLPPAPPQ